MALDREAPAPRRRGHTHPGRIALRCESVGESLAYVRFTAGTGAGGLSSECYWIFATPGAGFGNRVITAGS